MTLGDGPVIVTDLGAVAVTAVVSGGGNNSTGGDGGLRGTGNGVYMW